MLKWLDSLPLGLIIVAALFLGGAPFIPEPHLVEKIRMLWQGTLTRPIDMFDLFYHAAPVILLLFKLFRLAGTKENHP
jgi:hypothetical protein